jgi:ER lumen protein retaining receptor
MKIIYLVSTYFTLYLMYRKFRATYDRNHDTFRIEFLILPSAVLALLWNHEFSVLEVGVFVFLELISIEIHF